MAADGHMATSLLRYLSCSSQMLLVDRFSRVPVRCNALVAYAKRMNHMPASDNASQRSVSS